MSDAVFLGRLVELTPFVAELKPMAELVDGRWSPIEDAVSRFPKKGLVRADPNDLGKQKPKDSLWVFRCVPREDGKHAWQAEQPTRARPLVDLSGLSLEEARRILLDQGIGLPDNQIRQAVVVLADDAYCKGQFEPKDDNKQKWVLKLPPDGCIDIREADPRWRDSIRTPIGLFWPVLDERDDVVRTRIDWSSDRDLLHRLVDRFGRAVRAFSTHVEHSHESALKRLAKLLTESRIGVQDAGDLEALAVRVRRDWARIERDLAGLQELTELLLESAPGKALLHEAVRKRSTELEAELERELRERLVGELKDVRAELDAERAAVEKAALQRSEFAKEIEELQAREAEHRLALQQQEATLARIQGDVRQAEAGLERTHEEARQLGLRRQVAEDELRGLDAALERARGAIRELVSGARDALAVAAQDDWDGALAVAHRLQPLLEPIGAATPLLPSLSNPWSLHAIEPSLPVEVAELEQRFRVEAKAHGLVADDLVLLDGLARAGELVLLTGPQTEFALSAYVRVVSAGGLFVSALDPSVIGLDDLCRTPVSHRPTPLALAWHRAAADPDRVVVVCLRDLDSAPLRSWIASFAAALRSIRRPRNLVVLATLSSRRHDGDEAKEDDALRQAMVAIEPRATANAALAEVVLGAPRATPSALRLLSDTDDGLDPDTFMRLTSEAGSVGNARRALAVRSALRRIAESRADEWSAALAAYWAEGRTERLPEALRAGDRALAAMNVQP